MNIDKNKKIVIGIMTIILVITFLLIGKVFKNKTDDTLEAVKTSFLTSTILNIDDNYLTLQDENNIIYTFLVTDAVGLEVAVGESIELEYKGELDKTLDVQNNEVVGYKVLQLADGKVPTVWNDNGIFSKYYDFALETVNNLTLDEKIGQILLPRVPDKDAIEDLKKYKFGGYVLYTKDFQDKEKNEVINMINNYQNNSKIPLLIATDEEGGTIVRVSSNNKLVDTPFKSPSTLYKENGMTAIREDTINKSKVLSELGINVNLAPVVDVSTSGGDYIHERALGEDTAITKEYAKNVINASLSKNVSYVLKHFPGYGSNTDTHKNESIDTRDKDTVMKTDIPPFQAGISAGAEAVMMSHHVSEAFDKSKPASLSSDVHNVLRDDLGFTGIIMTDDLDMSALNTKYADTKVKDALLSGNDILIVTDYKTTITKIKSLIENGDISEDLITKLAFRIIAWKYYKGLIIPNQK